VDPGGASVIRFLPESEAPSEVWYNCDLLYDWPAINPETGKYYRMPPLSKLEEMVAGWAKKLNCEPVINPEAFLEDSIAGEVDHDERLTDRGREKFADLLRGLGDRD